MTIGEVIQQYRKDNALSQRQFAKRCNISNGYISMLEKGINPKTNEPIMPSIAALKTIASAMGITLNDLLIRADDMPVNLSSELILQARPKNVYPLETKSFPMLGRIACGLPIYAEEEFDTYVQAASNIQADFCVTAVGDSMINAEIHDGDIVFIRKQEIVENGRIAAVCIGDEATLKRWYYYPEEQKLVLAAENPRYAPLVYVGDELNDVRCLGLAVYKTSLVR